MEDIYIKVIPYLEEFAVDEIHKIVNKKAKKVDENLYLIHAHFENVFETVYRLVNFSRTVSEIYMKEVKTKIGEYNFLKDTLKVNDKEIDVYDLSSNILESRKYLLHTNSDTLNYNIINYCLFKLELHKDRSHYSVMDPISNFSEIIIEASSFNPRKPLYVKERYEMQVYENFRKIIKRVPKFDKVKDNNKYISIVDSDKAFKRSKENLSKSNMKIKVSKVDLEWLDLKYERRSIDYIISLLPIFKDKNDYREFLKLYLDMVKYLYRKKICIISREEIPKANFTKNKLKLQFETKLKDGIVDNYIYILK